MINGAGTWKVHTYSLILVSEEDYSRWCQVDMDLAQCGERDALKFY